MPFLLFSPPLHHCDEGRALGVDVYVSNLAVVGWMLNIGSLFIKYGFHTGVYLKVFCFILFYFFMAGSCLSSYLGFPARS